MCVHAQHMNNVEQITAEPSQPPRRTYLEDLPHLLHLRVARRQQPRAVLPPGLVVRDPLAGACARHDLHLDQLRVDARQQLAHQAHQALFVCSTRHKEEEVGVVCDGCWVRIGWMDG